MKEYVLSNNVCIPSILFGTWNLKDNVSGIVKNALSIGYRGIDAAYSYGNDFYVGKAIKSCDVPRDQVFVTNKLWNTFRGEEAPVEACKKSLRLMKLDYFDLYLVHWPEPTSNSEWESVNSATWYGMEKLYKDGLVRAIGVCNFLPHHIKSLIKNGVNVMPMVNQVEFHPGKFQKDVLQICSEKNITVEGWSPLGSGEVLNHPIILKLADKYDCSPSQICLKWVQSKQVIPVVRSTSETHMKENLLLPTFEFSELDVKLLDDLCNIGCSIFVPDVNQPN